MRPATPYVRKHVHRWTIRGEFQIGYMYQPGPWRTARRCADCLEVQVAGTADLDLFPKDMRAIADVFWEHPTAEETQKMRALVFDRHWKP